MGAVLLDGKSLSREIEDSLKIKVNELKKDGIEPHLAVILVGDDPASHVYVRNKENACKRTGIKSTKMILPVATSEEEVLQIIDEMNKNNDIHGILVQSPTPKHINELKITERIYPTKDVDGFHPWNLGKLVQGDMRGLIPCTPAGIMKLLNNAKINLVGKKVTVIGRSRIVGMPLSLMLAQKGIDATVTITHSRSKDIEKICMASDVIIAALGIPGFVKKEWIKDSSVIVDVGISRVIDTSTDRHKLVGDIEPSAIEKASYMTPVPGGVGPMTIAMLLTNTVKAAINN